MPKLLVLGAKGRVGSHLMREWVRADAIGVHQPWINYRDAMDVRAVLDGLKPDVIVNCAGYTDVDRAEEEAEQSSVYRLNRSLPLVLARWCDNNDRYLIQLSTDFVFNGCSPRAGFSSYKPYEPRSPINVYGKSKAAGEAEVLDYRNSIVVRISHPFNYCNVGKGDLLKTVLRQQETTGNNEVGPTWQNNRFSITPLWSLAQYLLLAAADIEYAAAGGPSERIYHAACPDPVDTAEFAQWACRANDESTVINFDSGLETLEGAAKRPHDTGLDCGIKPYQVTWNFPKAEVAVTMAAQGAPSDEINRWSQCLSR